MASEEFTLIPRDQLSSYDCQRCKMLRKHNMALNVAVTSQQYADVIKNIGKVCEPRGSSVVQVIDIYSALVHVWACSVLVHVWQLALYSYMFACALVHVCLCTRTCSFCWPDLFSVNRILGYDTSAQYFGFGI